MSNSEIEKYLIDIVWLFKFVRHFTVATLCGIFDLNVLAKLLTEAQRCARISFVINGFAYSSMAKPSLP